MKKLILAALLVAGCGGPSAPDPMTFTEIKSQVFKVSCEFSSCHSADGAHASNMLDLATDPYGSLVNVASVNKQAKSEGKNRVTPGDSANSFLYIKLGVPAQTVAGQKVCAAENVSDVSQITDYGSCMPQTSSPLDPVTIAAIKRWIDSGAPNN